MDEKGEVVSKEEPGPRPERFFGRSNIHRAGWTLLATLVAFTSGTLYSRITGKDKVIIATPEDGAKPLVVRIERTPGEPEAQSAARLDELKDSIQQLREDLTRPKHSQQGSASPKQATIVTTNSPFVPAFQMPLAVKGYYRAGLSGFGQATCPPELVTRGQAVLLKLFLEPRVNTAELSPVYVRVDRPEGNNQVAQVLEQQFVLDPGHNLFRVPMDFTTGVYDISLGFYARSELSRAYPNFYAAVCRVRLQ